MSPIEQFFAWVFRDPTSTVVCTPTVARVDDREGTMLLAVTHADNEWKLQLGEFEQLDAEGLRVVLELLNHLNKGRG